MAAKSQRGLLHDGWGDLSYVFESHHRLAAEKTTTTSRTLSKTTLPITSRTSIVRRFCMSSEAQQFTTLPSIESSANRRA